MGPCRGGGAGAAPRVRVCGPSARGGRRFRVGARLGLWSTQPARRLCESTRRLPVYVSCRGPGRLWGHVGARLGLWWTRGAGAAPRVTHGNPKPQTPTPKPYTLNRGAMSGRGLASGRPEEPARPLGSHTDPRPVCCIFGCVCGGERGRPCWGEGAGVRPICSPSTTPGDSDGRRRRRPRRHPS